MVDAITAEIEQQEGVLNQQVTQHFDFYGHRTNELTLGALVSYVTCGTCNRNELRYTSGQCSLCQMESGNDGILITKAFEGSPYPSVVELLIMRADAMEQGA